LGATVIPLGVSPDGTNINAGCGSTEPALLRAEVLRQGADLGIALDGDADRLIMADEQGQLIDGDQILALIARSWREAGRLRGDGVVATVMSNLGLERFLGELGMPLHRTKVGDRYVVERMRSGGNNLGGEQSGHMILSDFSTTGDGLVAALQILAVIVQGDRPASEVCRAFTPLPQRLKSIRFEGISPLSQASVKAAIRAAENSFGARGRVLIRESGTEPVVRVMAEGEDLLLVERVVDELCGLIAEAGRTGAATSAA